MLAADRYSLLEHNGPAPRIEEARAIAPGFSSPTVQPLHNPDWLAVKVMVEKGEIQAVVDAREAPGLCRGPRERVVPPTTLVRAPAL